MEMTGLNTEKDRILEVAMIITDENLNILEESVNMVVHQTKKTLDSMDEWCRDTHGKSGLTKDSLESKITISEIELILLK